MIFVSSRVVTPGATAPRTMLEGHRPFVGQRAGGAPADGDEFGHQSPRSDPRRIAASLDTFVSDGAPLPAATHIAAAARGFAEGNGFLPGQMFDRAI